MSTRDDILGRIRAALGRTAQNRGAALADVRAALSAHAAGPRPPLAADLLARFRCESERMSSTVVELASFAEVPAAVAHYLDRHALARRALVWPRLAGLEWAAAGVEVVAREARDGDLVGITGCFCAIAETGTLMTCSAPDSPAATSLLPETHIAVVPLSRLVVGMEEAWALARAEFGDRLPRAVNFISGPSRTGDIEMTIVLGAHGPYRVHILLVRDA
ncbi:MAG TPA: lactate utilization protein C [Rhodocyclaceae bacterium]|nr:lactate utilization protein C [Rhodocyclaceae bacterium]